MPQVLGVLDGSRSATTAIEKVGEINTVKNSFTITYYVLSDTTSDTEVEILLTSGIPPLYYPTNGAYVIGYESTQTKRIIHPLTGVEADLWEVEVQFDSSVDPERNQEDPTAQTPSISWSGEVEEEILEQDPITGDDIVNPVGEPIALKSPVVLPVLEISRLELYPFDPNTMLNYSHRTNSKVFWGAPIGSALMMPMQVSEENISGTKYVRAIYRIKFKIKPDIDEPWKARILAHGTKFRVLAGTEPVAAEDKFGNRITVNLALNGTKIPDGDPLVYQEFNRFSKADFDALSLGPF